MSVHGDGLGGTWVDDLDIDQPLGLSYRHFNHLAKGVATRIGKEHVDFADVTVGGEHIPGMASVLKRVDTTADISAAYDATTFRNGGLTWSEGQDVLFCITADNTTGDVTVMTLHPDRQWKGGDVTWAGAHEFDASVDFTGPVYVDNSADFSDVYAAGDISIAGTLKVATDFSLTGDMAVDGTTNLTGDVACAADFSIDGTLAMQDTVLTGDSTFTFDPIAGETGPTFKILGDWSQRAIDVTYAAARTDGIVTAFVLRAGTVIGITGHTPYGSGRVTVNTASGAPASVTFPVKAGNTWAIVTDPTTATTKTVYWLPFGDNT